MNYTTTLFLLLVICLMAIALAREVRLRRALQRLLRALLARFHPQESARESKKPPDRTTVLDDDAGRWL